MHARDSETAQSLTLVACMNVACASCASVDNAASSSSRLAYLDFRAAALALVSLLMLVSICEGAGPRAQGHGMLIMLRCIPAKGESRAVMCTL